MDLPARAMRRNPGFRGDSLAESRGCLRREKARRAGMMRAWLAMLTLTGCLAAAELKPLPWEKSSTLAIGRDLYRANCAVCHDIDKDKKQSRKIGPSLNHLFKNER